VRILFVYANCDLQRVAVPPYGLELLATALRRSGLPVEARLSSPFLDPRPRLALRRAIRGFQPDLLAFSLRNLDDAVVVDHPPLHPDRPLDTWFQLDRARGLLRAARRETQAPLLLGGAGFSAAPEGVLRYLGEGLGIVGPGEDIFLELVRGLLAGCTLEAALREIAAAQPGRVAGLPDQPRPQGRWPLATRRRLQVPWAAGAVRTAEPMTLAEEYDWPFPLRVAVGCNRRCRYCVEAYSSGGAVRQRPVEQVVTEARALARTGLRRLWLACSELNVPDARHAKELLRALARARLGVEFQAYFQPGQVDDELLDLATEAGIDPNGINYEFGHVVPEMLDRGAGPANARAIEALLERYLRRGHTRLGGSLVLGQPGETEQTLRRALERLAAMDRALPAGLGLAYSCGLRVYANSPFGQRAQRPGALASLRPHLFGRLSPGFALPLAYCEPLPPRDLAEVVAAATASFRGPVAAMTGLSPADAARLPARRQLFCGDIRRRLGAPERARGHYLRGLRLAPQDPDLHSALALAYLAEPRRPDLALRHLLQAEEILSAGPTGLAPEALEGLHQAQALARDLLAAAAPTAPLPEGEPGGSRRRRSTQQRP